MWAVFLTALLQVYEKRKKKLARHICIWLCNNAYGLCNSIILAFAAFHIYWAATLPLPFVIYYVCALLIPIFLFAAALAIIKENNQNWTRTKIHQCRCWFASKGGKKQKAAAAKTPTDDEEQQQQSLSSPPQEHAPLELNIPPPTNPYTKTLSLHLHHWQIFYMLAFFTRFTHPVSQVGAGIVLACYMEGICACKSWQHCLETCG